MFTLRFMSLFEDSEEVENVIAAPHYDVYTHRNGRKTVCTYKDHTSTDGVERHVMSDTLAKKLAWEDQYPDYYHVCYVENLAGKTISKISTK